jgi:hypothetical protein
MAEKLNREAWLNRMAEMLRPWFREHGYRIHGQMTVTMSTMLTRRLGFCTAKTQNEKGEISHIFVTAYEDGQMSDPVEVAGVLVHEIIHALMPSGTVHGKAFAEACKALGLEKREKWNTTPMAGLRAHLTALVNALPPLPRHGLKTPYKGPRSGGGNGTFKFQCDDCKTTMYIKYTSLTKAGTPCCWNAECDSMHEPMEDKTPPIALK